MEPGVYSDEVFETRLLLPYPLASFVAAHDRHIKVENDNIEGLRLLFSAEVAFYGSEPIHRRDHLEPALLQNASNDKELELVVVGD